MTPQQARQFHPADVVDLAEDLADATKHAYRAYTESLA